MAAIVLLPVLGLVGHAWQGSGTLWSELTAHVLLPALRDSLLLLAGVGLLVVLIGSGTAWLVTAYDFPGRRVAEWALLLPLAVPTYIVAFAYLDLWHPVGVLQTGLRGLLGIASPRDLRLPEIRSMGGCILVLGLVLYPYVYVPARAMFQMQAAGMVEAARCLGAGPARVFLRVALPLARPAVAVGASLALMEALNDIGASEFLGVRTLTVAVYSTWVNRGSLAGAAQIALAMLALVLLLIGLERRARRRQQVAAAGRQLTRLAPRRLAGPAAGAALLTVTLPVLFGFVLPAAYLVVEAAKRIQFAGVDPVILRELWNTVRMAFVATALTMALAFVLAGTLRLLRRRPAAAIVRVASLGYALPGTVLAVGLLGPLGAFDNALHAGLRAFAGVGTGLLLSASGAALVLAYVTRFLAVGAGSIESGLAKLPQALDDAARSLGAHQGRLAWRIHAPLAWPAIAAGTLLVFVDCMKELPATLLLRPLNFETLATHLYAEAARGSYESGAVAALLIVLAGLGPIILLARLGRAPRPGGSRAAQPAGVAVHGDMAATLP